MKFLCWLGFHNWYFLQRYDADYQAFCLRCDKKLPKEPHAK